MGKQDNQTRMAFGDAFMLALMVGAFWGWIEVVGGGLMRGTVLREWAGSLLTGLTCGLLLFAYRVTGRMAALGVMLLVAGAMKGMGAAILRLPVLCGAVANPLYAYATETLAMGLLLAGWGGRGGTRRDAGLGLVGAVASVGLFLPVGLVTGIGACRHGGTGLPLALVYGPAAACVGGLCGAAASRLAGWLVERWDTPGFVLRWRPLGFAVGAWAWVMLALWRLVR